eukprot:3863872-Prymnesium_polylepis.1
MKWSLRSPFNFLKRQNSKFVNSVFSKSALANASSSSSVPTRGLPWSSFHLNPDACLETSDTSTFAEDSREIARVNCVTVLA